MPAVPCVHKSSAPAAETIGTKVVSGIGWKVMSQVTLYGTRIMVAVLLARLLTPHDYGLAGMALAFLGIVALADLAMGAALIQRRVLTEGDRSTVFWTTVGVGLGLTLLGVALSGAIADFYGEPEVQALFAALSLTFMITALGATHVAVLTREMAFRRLELRLMGGSLIGAAVGVTVAAEGFGAWAIVFLHLTATSTSTLLLWMFSSWRPRLTFSGRSLAGLAGFGGNVFGTNIVFYLNGFVDKLLIGRFLGASALGVYALSYTLMLAPILGVAAPIRDVIFPAFARMQDDLQRMAAAWIRVQRMMAALLLPALLGIMVVAADFVQVVLGNRWNEAVPVIQILVWVGVLQSLQQLNGSVLKACDRTGTLLRFAVVSFVLTMTSFIVGLHWGIVGVAASYAAATTFLQPFYTWLTVRAVGLSLKAFARSLAGVAQAALLMAGCILLARFVMLQLDVAAPVRLVAVIVLGAGTYLACVAWRAPEVIAELRELRRRGVLLRARAATGKGSDAENLVRAHA